MSKSSAFERQIEKVSGGGRLSVGELAELEATPDILPLGMLADATRRRVRGGDVTYLRVESWGIERPEGGVPDGAREIRLTGEPPTMAAALSTVADARAASGARTVAGFTWNDIVRFATERAVPEVEVLREFRHAGLDALARVALDMEGGALTALEQLVAAGYQQLRVGVDRTPQVALFMDLAEFQERAACIQVVSPLPYQADGVRPTTGYQDVRAVAFARLAAPNVPVVQVDWRQYGPKLAQVALTFGADDLDGVSAADAAEDGGRRAPLTDLRRNVEAAGFMPVERDGRFTVVV
jgi:hypothetical protein